MKRLLILIVAVTLLTGCGYRLQTRGDLPFESIAIGEIRNFTYEPRLKDRMLSILAEALTSYGFSIANDARFRIEGEIKDFNMLVLSEKDLTASEYGIDISVAFRVTDTVTGKTYPVTILKPFSTHFKVRERFSEVLVQKDQHTKKALSDIAQEIVRYLLYDLAAHNAINQ